LTKRHIDGDRELFDLFEGIRDTTLAVRSAILAGDWDSVGKTLAAAHPQRKKLSPNITTPQMDHLIDTALANGAVAPKVCGAGGGGCIAFFCEEGRRKEVEAALSQEEGCEVLDWNFSESGLEIQIED
jgi:D-glycero-alpha-D-manno-heptose-7-phosphate kinase